MATLVMREKIFSVLRFIRMATLLAGAAVGVIGCAVWGDDASVAVEETESAQQIFARADDAFRAKEYKSAINLFEEVERVHPTSAFTKRAIIKSAHASFLDYDYDKTALTAARFLEFYPSDEQAPFAQYLVAMSFYSQITDVDRDQAVTKAALQSLREVVNRYPQSDYAREAKLKMDLTLDHLAGKEMVVGRYYLKRRQYIGAINRFQTVIESYQGSAHTAEALHRLVEAYLALGVVKEAQTAAAVLGHNFPGSDWYTYSYALLTGRDLTPKEDEGSWISQMWRRVAKSAWL